MLFDSEFVNNVVFNGSNVIDNVFEVFIKNEKYDEQRDIINKLLYELRQQITGNENVKKLDNQLSILTSKINYKKEKNTIDSRGMYSSIKSDKNIYNIPTELSKFSIFLTDKDKNIYELGLTEVKTPMGNSVRVYDVERCICDIIRSKNRMDLEHVKYSIKEYIKRKDKDLVKLSNYAKEMGIKEEVMNYIEVFYE